MLKVIVSGCNGKTGRVLFDCVKEDTELELVCGIARSAGSCPDEGIKIYPSISEVTESADVIIDFSHHSTLDGLLEYSLRTKTPLVLATTGYDDEDLKKIHEASKTIPIFLSYNMALGVNILIKLVKEAAKLLEGFDIEIVEKHHNRKADAPSGTAIMIADGIKEALPEVENTYGRHGRSAKRQPNEVGIHAIRGGTIVGEHDVIFAGDNEVVTLSHKSQSNIIFANGSIVAAKYLVKQKPGFYNMNDLLG